jgi:hypothetical protein
MQHVAFRINSQNQMYNVYLVEDGGNPQVIHTSLNGAPHDITNVSKSKDGTHLRGTLRYLWFNDDVDVMVSGDSISMVISGVGRYEGADDPNDSKAVIGFIQSLQVPVMA